jgi:two-component system LytT family response regulator
MIQTIIVDDESNNRQALKHLLELHCPSVELIGEADGVNTARELIQLRNPNLIFLDIQMPTGNGFQLLEQLKTISFDIIFVTSYDQYAITAIKFSALDYLLKPIDATELKEAVDKADRKLKARTESQLSYDNLLNTLKPGVTDKKMVIHENANAVLVSMSQVVCIEADSNYSFLRLSDGKTHHTAKTLKELEAFIQDLPGFIRINRSVIINVAYCSHYQKGEPYVAVLKNGLRFEISRRKRPEVLEELKSFLS